MIKFLACIWYAIGNSERKSYAGILNMLICIRNSYSTINLANFSILRKRNTDNMARPACKPNTPAL
jgi:hypothetical protein